MTGSHASPCTTPTRRARLGTAAAMVALAALIGPAPWVAHALGLASVGPGEASTTAAVCLAVVLVAIAIGDVAFALAPARTRAAPQDREV